MTSIGAGASTQAAQQRPREVGLRVLDAQPAAPPPVVILMNIGTPDAPTTSAVRRYLREFLSDPRVVDLPSLARWLLVRLIILPFRAPRSARLYRSIWTPRGSPLLVHTVALAEKLAQRLPAAKILIGMRYGNPGLAAAVAEVERLGATRVLLAPLFPQYASAASGTALAEAYRLLGRLPRVPDVSVLPPFFADDAYVASIAATMNEAIAGRDVEHVVFSYHGVPLRQVQRVHAACAGTEACCAALGDHNASCYRAQCVATTRLLVRKLGLEQHRVSTSFQSRLGRAVWIGPSTEETLRALGARGVKRVAVVCPSFVSDCLETIEEIGVEARATFQEAGGEELIAVPCVNARDDAAAALAQLMRLYLPRALPGPMPGEAP